MSNESGSFAEREIAAVESALLQLAPRAARIDANQFFYRAGQESVRCRRWLWPGTSVVLGLAVCTLGTLLALKPAPEIIEKVVHVPAPVKGPKPALPPRMKQEPQPPTSVPADRSTSSGLDSFFVFARLDSGYLQLRNQALRWGVESLPFAVPGSTSDLVSEPMNLLKMQADWVGKATEF